MKTFIFLLVPSIKRAPYFIHCEGRAAKGGGVLIMIPTCNAHAYMKFSKKNFVLYVKNATVKNIITILNIMWGWNVLTEQLLLVTLSKQKRLQFLFRRFGFRFLFWFRFWLRFRFRIPAFPYALKYCYSLKVSSCLTCQSFPSLMEKTCTMHWLWGWGKSEVKLFVKFFLCIFQKQ